MGIHSFTDGREPNDVPPPNDPTTPGSPGKTTSIVLGPAIRSSGPTASSVPDVLVDYNARFRDAEPALFRDRLVQQVLAVLIRRRKPNPLLVGPAGVGKTKVVEEVARLIANGSPLVPPQLASSTVYELPLGALMSGAGMVGELESRVLSIVEFLTDPANDAVVFVDEVHLLTNAHDRVYSKIAQLLKPAMARGDMRLIAATTAQEARSVDDDPAFSRRLARLVVDELTPEQTVAVLEAALPGLVSHYRQQVAVPPTLLPEVVRVSEDAKRADQHRPDSALTLLDQSMADLVVSRGVAASALQGTLSGPVALGPDKLETVARRLASGSAEPPGASRAFAVRSELAARLVGQDAACGALADALERESLRLEPRVRPMAWLLAGPSGVGKTAAAEAVAQCLTGQPAIVLNMAEYSLEHDQSKLMGSGPGYVGSESNRELPFDTLESNPYRLVLLDELEKAHPAVRRLLLSALDKGWLRMASGKLVDFSKALVVGTTNAGAAELAPRPIGFTAGHPSPPALSQAQVAEVLKRNGFEPEFLGRFEEVVGFAPLSRESYEEVLRAEYARLASGPSLTARGVVAPVPSDAEFAAAVDASYVPALGARPALRTARRLLEDAVLAANPMLVARS